MERSEWWPLSVSEIWRRGLEKGHSHKIVRNLHSNSRRIYDNFAHLPLKYDTGNFVQTCQDTFENEKGRKSAIWGRRTGSFFEFSPVNCFPFSPGFLCNLVRKPPQNVKIARFPGSGRRKKLRILSRLWLSWFFLIPNLVCNSRQICATLPFANASALCPSRVKFAMPHKRGLSFLFQNCPRGEGNCAATISEVSRRGWREGAGDKQTPKNSQKFLQYVSPFP